MRRGTGRRRPTGADTAAEVARQDRRFEALRLRVSGLSNRAIGKKLGISHVQAMHDVARALEERGQETREQLRGLANGALEAVLEGHVERARGGDDKSAKVVVAAVAEHSKINGYKAPERLELAGPNGGPMETKTSVHEDLLSRISRVADAIRARRVDPKPDGGGS
jgi:transposase